MNNEFFKKVEAALAVERLDVFREDGDEPLVVLSSYLWNIALCEALYSPLQMAEIALRNRIHMYFSEQFSVEDWYITSGLLLSWQEEQVDKVRKELAERGCVYTAGQVVAELHFGFWTGFFNKAHEDRGIAHALIKPVFSHAPKYERVAGKLGRRWAKIRELRNRVFHHERISHRNDLSALHEALVETIGWISPELRELTEKLNTFTGTYSAGIEPWKEKIRSHWPVDGGGLK
jgi:hypothetical protein